MPQNQGNRKGWFQAGLFPLAGLISSAGDKAVLFLVIDKACR